MQEKIEKAKLHRVILTGTMEHRFEVLCKDRTGRGIRRDRVVHESLITVDGKAFCSCMKPKLLHLPCSHLIAACVESGLQPGVFISPYFSKEAAVSTWGHEVYGIGIVGPFIQDNEDKMFIPDLATKKRQRPPSDTSYSEWYGRVRSKQSTKALQPMWSIGS